MTIHNARDNSYRSAINICVVFIYVLYASQSLPDRIIKLHIKFSLAKLIVKESFSQYDRDRIKFKNLQNCAILIILYSHKFIALR